MTPDQLKLKLKENPNICRLNHRWVVSIKDDTIALFVEEVVGKTPTSFCFKLGGEGGFVMDRNLSLPKGVLEGFLFVNIDKANEAKEAILLNADYFCGLQDSEQSEEAYYQVNEENFGNKCDFINVMFQPSPRSSPSASLDSIWTLNEFVLKTPPTHPLKYKFHSLTH